MPVNTESCECRLANVLSHLASLTCILARSGDGREVRQDRGYESTRQVAALSIRLEQFRLSSLDGMSEKGALELQKLEESKRNLEDRFIWSWCACVCVCYNCDPLSSVDVIVVFISQYRAALLD